MIVVTGGAGFIGSNLVRYLNRQGVSEILIVDNLASSEKWKNLRGLRFQDYLHKETFIDLVRRNSLPDSISGIVHLGACSATTERNVDYLMENNYRYTRTLAEFALTKGRRMVYASSAATYGAGEAGYNDDESTLQSLIPLNPYGYSKHIFDLYAHQHGWFDKICGLKFFNVYGPYEYHKDSMRSVVYNAFFQAKNTGAIKLFKSYRSEFAHGAQCRDFIYVEDCAATIWWLLNNPQTNGVYNLGFGKPRTWNDLARAVFDAMGLPEKIEYIEMPEQLRGQYQYFTEANMQKFKANGCSLPFHSLEAGVKDYVTQYLSKLNQ